MRILHSVPNIGRISAGPSYSIVGLCRSLSKSIELELVSLDKKELETSLLFLRAFPSNKIMNKLGVSKQLKKYFFSQTTLDKFDLFHAHSLWMFPNIYPIQSAFKNNKPSIISPRGTLAPEAMREGSVLKPIFWKLFQKPSLKKASFLHATSSKELNEIRNLGFSQPIIKIPNGIEVPCKKKIKKNIQSKQKKLLFLGRIHPIKGLENLIKAWREVQYLLPDWDLNLVGPDIYGHKKALINLMESIGCERIFFYPEVVEAGKENLYLNTDLFILPSKSENFGMVVAEALSFGIPCIVSNGCPWPLDKISSGWTFKYGVDNLVSVLKIALSQSSSTYSQMGKNGRSYINKNFNQDVISEKWLKVYNWIINKDSDPPEEIFFHDE